MFMMKIAYWLVLGHDLQTKDIVIYVTLLSTM